MVEKQIGPIKFKFRKANLNEKQIFMSTVLGFVSYVILISIIEFTILNIIYATIVAIITSSAVKKWFQYKKAKENREHIESNV